MNILDIKRELEAAGHTVKHRNPINFGEKHDDLRVWAIDGGEPISKKEMIAYATGFNLVSPPSAAQTQDLPTSFVLQGFRYYAQGRKCSKKNCKCREGQLHGPYWYRREIASGKRKYIGKKLPMVIVACYLARKDAQSGLEADINALQSRLQKLRMLQRNEALSQVDKIVLQSMGYSDCLV